MILKLKVTSILGLMACGCMLLTGCEKQPAASGSSSQGGQSEMPSITVKSTAEIQSMSAMLPTGLAPELCPVPLTIGGRNHLVISTSRSALVRLGEGKTLLDAFNQTGVFDYSGGLFQAVSNNAVTPFGSDLSVAYADESAANAADNWKAGAPYWKRSYYGIFQSQAVTVNGKQYILNVMHGENKNEKHYNGKHYKNTVLPDADYTEEQYSGVGSDGVYYDYSDAYFSFIGLTCVPMEKWNEGAWDSPEYDYGPVIWMENPYLDLDGSNRQWGVRHPSLVTDDKYIYIYYIESSRAKVARAPLAELGKPGSFKIWDGKEFSNDALPVGFDKSSRSFFRRNNLGGKDILGTTCQRFAVAKLTGTDYFIGVEDYYDGWPKAGIRLRLSKDMVNWTDGTIVPGTEVAEYINGTMHYAMLFNKDMTTTNVVDPEEFYLVGIAGNGLGKDRIECMKLSITLALQ